MGNPWHPWNSVPGHPDGHYRVIGMIVDAKGEEITTGRKQPYVVIPYNGRFVGWDLFGEPAGSIIIDVWKKSTYPPTVADTITGSEKPTLVSQLTNQDLALTTWDRVITKGDYLAFSIDSASTLTHVSLELRVLPD